MSKTRLMSSARTRGLCSATRAWIRSATCWALAKKSRPSGRRISRPSNVSSSRVLGRQRPQHVGSPFAADHVDIWVGRLAGQAYQR